VLILIYYSYSKLLYMFNTFIYYATYFVQYTLLFNINTVNKNNIHLS
jgi:hypothetical protein